MKHERGMKALLGQNGTSGGNQDSRQAFYTGQSVYGNYTSARGGRKDTKEERGGEGKVLCQYIFLFSFFFFLSIYCHLLRVIPPRTTEILIEGEGH